jgi:hypothetical protein
MLANGRPMSNTRLKRMPDKATVVDENGIVAHLISEGMLKCQCQRCHVIFYLASNVVNVCPCCCHKDIEKIWTKPQTLLVPESESPAFMIHKNSRGI